MCDLSVSSGACQPSAVMKALHVRVDLQAPLTDLGRDDRALHFPRLSSDALITITLFDLLRPPPCGMASSCTVYVSASSEPTGRSRPFGYRGYGVVTRWL